jgi:site-specific DNA-adenine methylase
MPLSRREKGRLLQHILHVLDKYLPASGGSFADLFVGGSVLLTVAERLAAMVSF